MISMIVAMDRKGAIASSKHNGLMWNIPTDLKYFKQITYGSIIVMGRKTYDSIGHPLPKRENVILTTDKNFCPDAPCRIFHTLEDVVNHCYEFHETFNVFIIGGATIYKQMMPYIDKLYITKIDACFQDGDIFFPEVSNDFKLISETKQYADGYNLSFEVYQRNV